MNQVIGILVIIAVPAVLIGGLLLLMQVDKAEGVGPVGADRARERSELAQRMGFAFDAGSGTTQNVVSGTWNGVPFRSYDWGVINPLGGMYVTSSVAETQVPLRLPGLQVMKGGKMEGLTRGWERVTLESPDFNRQFDLYSEDRAYAYELIDVLMEGWLPDAAEGFYFATQGGTVWAGTDGAVDDANFNTLLDRMAGFLQHIPKIVWNDYRAADPATDPA